MYLTFYSPVVIKTIQLKPLARELNQEFSQQHIQRTMNSASLFMREKQIKSREWHRLVIPTTSGAEVRGSQVQGQPIQCLKGRSMQLNKTLSEKKRDRQTQRERDREHALQNAAEQESTCLPLSREMKAHVGVSAAKSEASSVASEMWDNVTNLENNLKDLEQSMLSYRRPNNSTSNYTPKTWERVPPQRLTQKC